jgi:hypothetical protein
MDEPVSVMVFGVLKFLFPLGNALAKRITF